MSGELLQLAAADFDALLIPTLLQTLQALSPRELVHVRV